jgi:hypothetical protein
MEFLSFFLSSFDDGNNLYKNEVRKINMFCKLIFQREITETKNIGIIVANKFTFLLHIYTCIRFLNAANFINLQV